MAETESETAAEPMRPLPLAPIGRVAAIAGPVLVILSGWLEWIGRKLPDSSSAYEIPAKFVIDSEASPGEGGLSLGIVILVAGVIGLIGALVPRARILIWVSGGVTVVVALLFAFQFNDFIDRVNQAFGPGFGARNSLGVGGVLAGAGGVLTLVGAALIVLAARRGPDATEHETRGES
ncbi:MAG: hypothetical protein ACRDZ1_11460 [Acidimicrobiia bacterium]